MDRQEKIETILALHTQHMREWIELLCNSDELFNLFIDEYIDVKCLPYSLVDFQSYLKSIGRGRNITADQLQECVNKKDFVNLKLLLEEVLLLPIDNETVKRVKQRNITKLLRKLKVCSNMGVIKFTGDYVKVTANLNIKK